jgi:2-phosphosulfolactate phosphatase
MRIECEWGLQGIEHLRDKVGVLVIVDVLSFSTSVDIAVSRGANILPFPHSQGDAARDAAKAADAVLAAPRFATEPNRLSLSPASLQRIEPGTRLLLPSPNGSRLSLAGGPRLVIAGCLRNASAVAKASLRLADGRSIGVIPAGEQWDDGSLRPAIEDQIGAGAIIAALAQELSAEAQIACQAFRSARPELLAILNGCASGIELRDRGFDQDVRLAAEYDCSIAAPVLRNGVYSASF